MASGSGEQSPTNVMHHLKGIDFPAKKGDLVAHAKGSGAPSEVMAKIEAMPDGSYDTVADVMKGFGRTE
jgi:hypothetical protein